MSDREPEPIWKRQAVRAWRTLTIAAATERTTHEEDQDAIEAALLQERLAGVGIVAEVDGGHYEAGGLLFTLSSAEDGYQLVVLRHCSRCHKNLALSPAIRSIEELGYVIDEWQAECADCENGLTDTDDLAALEASLSEILMRYIRALVFRHLPHVEDG